MPIQNVGDLSQHFKSLRQVGEVKSSLNRLSNELTTQRKSDVTASLGGATSQLEAFEREIGRLTSYSDAAQRLGQRLSYMQTTLASIEDVRSAAMSKLLNATTEPTVSAVQSAAETGKSSFTSFVSSFNQRLGNVALFSGAATDKTPLLSGSEMLIDINAMIVGLDTSDDILTAVDTWFDDPAGGFATIGYLGDTGLPQEHKISKEKNVTIDIRSDSATTVLLLKAAAVAALADESNASLTEETRAELVAHSGQLMLNAGDSLTNTRAMLGRNEAAVEEASVALSMQLTAFKIDRNDITVSDPFETATRLQDVQQQLEMQYTVTARLSQLSLVNFLR